MNTKLRPVLLALLLVCSTLGTVATTDLEPSSEAQTSARSIACSGDICLNEALPNPNGYDDATWPNGEWVEIHNKGNTTVDVLGWYVTNKAAKTMYFNETTIVDYNSSDASSWEIAPGGYMVVARNGLSSSLFYLANTNDIVTLHTDAGTSLHQATWTFSSSGSPSGVSLEEDALSATNDWVATNTPTPGGINTGSGTGGPAVLPADLTINEVMADAWPSFDGSMWPGGEWIEVTNTGSLDFDMTGWSIEDQAGKVLPFNESHLIDAESIGYLIAPGATRVIAVNGSGTSMLNNGVEMLNLKWPNGTIAQQVYWTDNEPGFSLVDDPTSAYMTYASYPTPNAPNPLPIDQIAATASPVGMTELLSNSSEDGTSFPTGEWLELFNEGTVDIDLTGWSIIDGMGNVTMIDPSTLAVNDTQAGATIDAESRRIVQFTAGTELWNFYNHLMLVDNTGSVVDAAWYAADYGTNVSLVPAENPTDPWVPAPWMTPGHPEPGTMDNTGEVTFSEVMPDGVGSDSQPWPLGEWLEIMNHGEQPIDVAGWKLQAASRSLTLHQYNMPLQSTSVIQPGAVALIALNGTSSFYLKHTTPDSIGLVDATGAVIDTIAWSTTVEGEALVAPNSTHAGAGPDGTGASTGTEWILAAWTSPGRVNPVWPTYTGSENATVTEVLAYCNDDSIEPVEDWIEIMNTGSDVLNLSRWRIDTISEDRRFIRSDAMWGGIEGWNATLVQPGERAVVLMDDSVLTGLGDSFILSNPDGVAMQTVQWSIVSDCQTMMPGETAGASWVHTMWPTPGAEEPNASQFAQLDDIKFTRLMTEGYTSISSNTEFFEISNMGDNIAYLDGWTFTVVTSGGPSPHAFTDVMISANSATIFAADPNGLSVYEDGTILGFASSFTEAPTLPDDGAALHIMDPTGAVADTIVYGNGPVEVDGWNGISLVEPVSGINLIIYHRGDGCGQLADTNAASDWHERWGRLGGSTFCEDQGYSGESVVTPLIGPMYGLLDVLDWIEGANTSLHLHVYQLSEARLVQALIDAQGRGVDVTVVLDAGSPGFWSDYDMLNQYGMASELVKAGVTTYWFGDGGVEPYAYIHSKVAVRDGSSVWISSGNWKSPSMPAPGVRGNVDWGVLIHNVELAGIVLGQMAFDEEPLRQHITPASASDEPNGWVMPTESAVDGVRSTPITATVSGELLTCPDNCIEGLVELIDSAEDELLLSLQYLDMDWSWGWGDNPIFTALRQSAENGVSVRLIINGAYLDQDVQDVVDTFNEVWNSSDGLDVAAIVMGEDDNVTKLHNKGLIIDQETVLVSSINWGNSAVNRNREMGLIMTSSEVATPYLHAWYEDWNRLDNVTDTDQDGLPDIWEVPNGLNRTKRMLPGPNMLESLYDADNDGISNENEYTFGSHPTNADTDGDCIPDGVEVAWAQATALDPNLDDVSPRDALLKADADNDGVNESDALGCDLGGIDVNDNTTEPVDNASLDDDNDGVKNSADKCPATPADVPINVEGCSSEQRLAQATPSGGEETGFGAGFMLALMIAGVVLAIGAFLVLRNIEAAAEGKKDLITLDAANHEALLADPIESQDWQTPVLDGTGPASKDEPSGINPGDLARMPGWDEGMIQGFLDQGWPMDQLVEYYEEQVVAHDKTSQD
jgi:phosphatidylserine/phosphatidylglycerophosphate/cardiolipin synthase-like enzyme